jgi:hypothetical protein
MKMINVVCPTDGQLSEEIIEECYHMVEEIFPTTPVFVTPIEMEDEDVENIFLRDMDEEDIENILQEFYSEVLEDENY